MKKILSIGFVTLLGDILVKILVIKFISYNSVISIIKNFFYITYLKNTGGAFSILTNNTLLLAVIGLVCVGILIYYLVIEKRKFHTLEIISYGILIGGVIGNFLDRIIYSGVIDYIGFKFGTYYFPVFNFADMCIVSGVFLLFIDSIRGDK